MSNSSANQNTTGTVSFTVRTPLPVDICVDQDLLQQITRSIVGTVDFSALTQNVVKSPTAPADKTVLWQMTDPTTGIPIGQVKNYDPDSGEWIPQVAVPESGDVPCLSEDGDNVIIEDANGCWKLPGSAIPKRNTDSDNLIIIATDGSWKVQTSTVESIATPKISADNCNTLESKSDGFFTGKHGPVYLSSPVQASAAYAPSGVTIDPDALGVPVPDCATHVILSFEGRYDGISAGGGTVANPILSIQVNGREYVGIANIDGTSSEHLWFAAPLNGLTTFDYTTVSSAGTPSLLFNNPTGRSRLLIEGFVINGNYTI